jgi:hypothetical protein
MEIAVPAGHAASAELGGPSWSFSVAFPLARRSGPGITQPWGPGQNCPGRRCKPFSESCCVSITGGPIYFGKLCLPSATSQSGWSNDSLPFRRFRLLQRPDQHNQNPFYFCHRVVKIPSALHSTHLRTPRAELHSKLFSARFAVLELSVFYSQARASGFSARRPAPIPSSGTAAPVGTIIGTLRRYSAYCPCIRSRSRSSN